MSYDITEGLEALFSFVSQTYIGMTNFHVGMTNFHRDPVNQDALTVVCTNYIIILNVTKIQYIALETLVIRPLLPALLFAVMASRAMFGQLHSNHGRKQPWLKQMKRSRATNN